MDLFGYSEKTYNKNSENFKSQLQNIYNTLNMRGIYDVGVGNAITNVMNQFDMIDFPSGKNRKEQKAVDDYIGRLIGKLQVSAQQKNVAKFVIEAKMLSDIIIDSRSCGKLLRTEKELQSIEILNDCLGELNQAGVEKENIKNRKNEILKECKRLDSLGANTKIIPLKNEYIQLEQREKAIEMKENELAKTYEYNCKALAKAEDRQFYNNLGKGNFVAMNPQAVGKLINEIDNAIEKNNEAVNTGNTLIDEFDSKYAMGAGMTSSTSSFDAAFEHAKAEDAMNDIGNAKYSPSEHSNTQSSSFDAAFKNFQG